MRPQTAARRSQPLPAGLRDLVRHAAESLGISLEIWAGPGRPPERLAVGPACEACEQANPRLFDRCRKRRSYLVRPEANVPQEMAEKCPLKLRLARLGGGPDGSAPTFFGFGYRPPAGADAEQDERVLSFLRDLRRMVDESAGLQGEMLEMTDELSTRYEEINLLYSISGKLSRADDLHTTVVNVLSEWRKVLDAECALMWLRDRALLEFSFSSHQDGHLRTEARPIWEQFARRLADTLERSGGDFWTERLGAQHPISRLLGQNVDCIAVQVETEGRPRGVVCGLRRAEEEEEFGTPEVRLLRSLSAQLGLALTNSDLYEDLKEFLTGTVKTLVAAIDAKDSYTCGHSERVNIVSMLIGNEMNLDLDDLQALYWGSLLHDVGKIGMPESILNKPSDLDDAEIEIVKQHPARGWEMLHAITRLQSAALGVRYHHERWDGQGYPQGLRGEDIPIIARIIAVADAFDAIISNRSYRKGQSAGRALEVIQAESEQQFDPGVVAALHRLLPLLDKHQWILMSGQKVSVNY